jgi:hypothetical protein
MRKIYILAAAVVYVAVFGWIFIKNLTSDTDYPYHLHAVWAVNQGHLLRDPFLNRGNSFTLAYGAPAYLLGGVLYPLSGVYTVALLLLLVLPFLWLGLRHLFGPGKDADLIALACLLNPLTVYFFLTSKLPFLWSLVFAAFSLSMYKQERRIPAVLLGFLAVITHPLSLAFLAAVLLVRFELREWLVFYSPVCLVALLQLLLFFGVGGGGGPSPLSLHNLLVLVGSLFLLLALRPQSRLPFLLAISLTVLALAVGFPSSYYFDRLAWAVLTVSMPFILPFLTRLKSPFPFLLPFCVVPLLIAGATAAVAYPDNPEVYENLIAENSVIVELREGYVRYSGDGAALYFLPLAGVRFSNSGALPFEMRLENDPLLFCKRMAEENVSFVLVYSKSPEENYLLQLNFPLFYSQENLRIYEVPEWARAEQLT